MGYDAFISYRHGADDDVAAAIERGLERLARPWNRLRAMSVFRDQSDLAAESDLSGAITRTLDDTRFLVLLASPESAGSPWVDKEVAYWCEQGNGVKQLIVVVTDGKFEWDEVARALTPSTDAVSPAVRSLFTNEPLYVDLRWARAASELSLRESRFRSAIVLIAATIRGVAPSDLESEDVRLHRRTRRLARAAVATVLVLALVASVAAVEAVANARRADQRAREALGRQLGLAALELTAPDVEQALLLSLVGANLETGDDAGRFRASRELMARYARLQTLLPTPLETTGLRSVAVSDDDVVAATTRHDDGTAALLIWPTGTSESMTEIPLDRFPDGASLISFLGDERLLIGEPEPELEAFRSSGPSIIVTMNTDGTDSREFRNAVAIDIHGRTVAESTPAGEIKLIDLDSEEVLASAVDASGLFVDLQFGRVTTASADEIVTLDAEGGTAARASLPPGAFVTAIAAGPTANVAAISASLGEITPWSWSGDALHAGEAVALPEGVGRPEQLVVAPNGERVLVVGKDGSALVNVVEGAADTVDRGVTGRVVVDPSGRYAAFGGARLSVWDLDSGRLTFAMPLPVNAMAWSGDCEAAEDHLADDRTTCRLVTAGGSLNTWDPDTGRRVELVDETDAQSVAISADGETVVTTSWLRTVAVWRLRPIPDESEPVEVTEQEVEDVLWGTSARGLDFDDSPCGSDMQGKRAMSPSGTYVVSYAPDNGTTTVCDTDDRTVVAKGVLGDKAVPVSVVAVDDEGHVALGGGDGFVERFPRNGDEFEKDAAIFADLRLGSEPVEVTSIAYDAGTIVAGLRPANEAAVARVLVWPVADDGTPSQFFTDHLQVPAIGLLGDDAGHVVAAGRDRPDGPVTLQVWETSTAWRLGRALRGLSGDVIALGGDESAVYAADASGNAYRWELDGDPTDYICGIVGRELTESEWNTLAHGVLRGEERIEVCAESQSNSVTSGQGG